MKNIFIFLCFVFLGGSLFAFELSGLEKQIITAKPEEMLNFVLDRNFEEQLNAVCNRMEDQNSEEIIDACKKAFPGISDDECLFIIIKLGLVCTLGSGDRQNLDSGLEILEFLSGIESMLNFAEVPEDLEAFVESTYWQDCLAFTRLLDIDSFLMERFPED